MFQSVLDRGGPIMYALLGLSLLAVTLIFERCWFWARTNRPGRVRRLRQISEHLRQGRVNHADALIEGDGSVYGQVARMLRQEKPTDALVTEAVEGQIPRLERFMPTLGTIITAAPMLGILGTVTGIISSFRVLSEQQTITDPRVISGGIAEALLTTVAGLLVALLVLFPYNAFRAQVDRTLGRLDALAAAAQRAEAAKTTVQASPEEAGD